MVHRNDLLPSLAGLPIPQLVQLPVFAGRQSVSLAGLPIPQLVQFMAHLMQAEQCLAGLPIPQLVQSGRTCGRAP